MLNGLIWCHCYCTWEFLPPFQRAVFNLLPVIKVKQRLILQQIKLSNHVLLSVIGCRVTATSIMLAESIFCCAPKLPSQASFLSGTKARAQTRLFCLNKYVHERPGALFFNLIWVLFSMRMKTVHFSSNFFFFLPEW